MNFELIRTVCSPEDVDTFFDEYLLFCNTNDGGKPWGLGTASLISAYDHLRSLKLEFTTENVLDEIDNIIGLGEKKKEIIIKLCNHDYESIPVTNSRIDLYHSDCYKLREIERGKKRKKRSKKMRIISKTA